MMLQLFILNLNFSKNIPHTTASINGSRENQEDLDVAMLCVVKWEGENQEMIAAIL